MNGTSTRMTGHVNNERVDIDLSDEKDVAASIVPEYAQPWDPAVEKRVVRKIDTILMPFMWIGYGLVYYDKVCLPARRERGEGSSQSKPTINLNANPNTLPGHSRRRRRLRHDHRPEPSHRHIPTLHHHPPSHLHHPPLLGHLNLLLRHADRPLPIDLPLPALQSRPGTRYHRGSVGGHRHANRSGDQSPGPVRATLLPRLHGEHHADRVYGGGEWLLHAGGADDAAELVVFRHGRLDGDWRGAELRVCEYHGGSLTRWQYLYLLAGAVTVVFGVCCFWLPNSPASAWWFNEQERMVAIERLRMGQMGVRCQTLKWRQIREAMLDPKVWILGVMMGAAYTVNGAVTGFGPLIVSTFGYTAFEALLWQMPLGAVCFVSILLTGYLSLKFPNIRLIMLIACCLPVITGCAMIWKGTWSYHAATPIAGYTIIGFFAPVTSLTVSTAMANVAGASKKSYMAANIFFSTAWEM